jgi:hypothetical protein
MKKITLCTVALGMSLACYPVLASASATPKMETVSMIDTKTVKPSDEAEAKILQSRLNEINKMDKSGLKFAEKRMLRKEVRSINHRLSDIGGGVYISVGAAIIIILLLIILL